MQDNDDATNFSFSYCCMILEFTFFFVFFLVDWDTGGRTEFKEKGNARLYISSLVQRLLFSFVWFS